MVFGGTLGPISAISQTLDSRYQTNTVEEMAGIVMFLSEADAPSSVMGTDIDVTMGMLTGPFGPRSRGADHG